jgi:hypothetical protein
MAVSQTFTVTKVSQDIATNTSVIRIVWKTTQTGGSYNNNLNTAFIDVYVNDVKTKTLQANYKLTANTTVTVYDGTVEVQHNDVGECTVKVKGWMDTGISAGEINHSKTLELPMIPRVSTLSGSNGTLGISQKLVINRAADTLTHRITYNCGEQSGYVNGSTDHLTGDSYTWTPPLSLASENTTGTSVSVKLFLWTYAPDGTHIGTESLTLSYAIPVSIIPSISQITVTDTTTHSQTYGQPVQGLSKMKVQVETTEAYESDIVECTIAVNGAKYNTNPATTDELKDSGELDITVTVKDKRGRTATKKKPGVYVLAYSPPKVTQLEVHRCDKDGNDDAKGLFVRVNFSAEITKLNGINTAAYRLEYRQNVADDGPEEPMSVIAFDGTNGTKDLRNVYTVINEAFIFAAGENDSYVVTITATDAHDADTRTTRASTGFTMLNWNTSGTGMGVGKVSEKANAVEFGLDVYDNNGGLIYGWNTLVDMLLPVGTIVMRYDMENPGELYPGTTWTQIAARVLRAVGTSGTIGEEGSIDSGGSGGRTYIDVAVWKRTK